MKSDPFNIFINFILVLATSTTNALFLVEN